MAKRTTINVALREGKRKEKEGKKKKRENKKCDQFKAGFSQITAPPVSPSFSLIPRSDDDGDARDNRRSRPPYASSHPHPPPPCLQAMAFLLSLPPHSSDQGHFFTSVIPFPPLLAFLFSLSLSLGFFPRIGMGVLLCCIAAFAKKGKKLNYLRGFWNWNRVSHGNNWKSRVIAVFSSQFYF